MNDEIKNIELNIRIGHLVLNGIPLAHYQQQQLKEIVEAQLKEMFSANGIPSKIETLPGTIKGSTIHLHQQPSTHQLGKQIAASIYNGLSNNIERRSKKTFNA